jgi:dsDNA-specific endonuclease/ATPase MutS2
MKRLWLLSLLLMAGLAWGQGTAWAKRDHEKKVGSQRAETGAGAIEGNRWQQLSPEQRKELQQRYRHFQELPAAEQKKLRQRYERFRELSPEKKQRMLERHQKLQQLTPEQREALHKEWKRIKQLPPEDRSQQRKKLHQQYFNGSNGR